MRPVLSRSLAIGAALIAATALVLEAAALTITTAPISFPNVTLNGASQTVDGSTSAWQADATGESGGWKVTVASTDFTNGSGKTIAVDKFEIRLLDVNIVRVSGDPNGPVSTQTTFAALGAAARKIASAAVNTGDGVYDLTPNFRLTVPAETYSGSYTATVTVSISSGP
ncbi:MAG: hypothetical protein ABSB57_00840 [Dehalococcoidia bacterium]